MVQCFPVFATRQTDGWHTLLCVCKGENTRQHSSLLCDRVATRNDWQYGWDELEQSFVHARDFGTMVWPKQQDTVVLYTHPPITIRTCRGTQTTKRSRPLAAGCHVGDCDVEWIRIQSHAYLVLTTTVSDRARKNPIGIVLDWDGAA